MNLPERKNLIKIICYFAIFVLPVLGMQNCGWNTSVGLTGCYFDSSFTRFYANAYYWFIFASAFLLLIPIIVYVAFGIKLTKFLASRFSQKQS